jgi:hypothetical protein
MNKKNDTGQAAKAFYDKRRVWMDYICGRDDISDRAFRVGYWLARKMNGEDQCCWYSVRKVSEIMGISQAKVMRATMELESTGLLIIVRTHRKTNSYSIRLPFETV